MQWLTRESGENPLSGAVDSFIGRSIKNEDFPMANQNFAGIPGGDCCNAMTSRKTVLRGARVH